MSRDDLFDDDDFNFDDDPFGDDGGVDDAEDFSFDDDEGDGGDFGSDLGGFDDDGLGFDESDEERRGPNTIFILLAIMMFLTFLGGIGLILFLATREEPISGFDLTSTIIAVENEGTIAAATQNAILRATTVFETEVALNAQNTATAEAQATSLVRTETAVAQLTADSGTIVALTQIALSATPTPIGGGGAGLDLPGTQTMQAFNLTATSVQLTADAANVTAPPLDTPAPEETEDLVAQPTLDSGQVALTATAIAQALRGGGATPTQLVIASPGGGGEAPPTGEDPEMPATGLLDDLASDQGLLMVVLASFALLAVIAVSRTVRAANSRYL